MTAMDIVRDRVLAHSFGRASAHGLSALSMSDLARDLGLARSSLLAHFPDKDALQLGVIEMAASLFVADVVEASAGVPAGEPRLRELVQRWLMWSRAPRLKGGCPFVHASAEGDALPQPVRDQLDVFRAQWSATLRTAIEDAKSAGELASDVDAEQMIFELYGLYLSHHFWHWSMKDRSALDRTKRAFERLLSASKQPVAN